MIVKYEQSPREAREMNEKNLIPNSERSPKELREMGHKGGIKSGESRRKKAQARKTAEFIAKVFLESEEGRKLIETFKTS